MKKLLIFLSNWTLVASLIVAAITSLVVPGKIITGLFETLMCDYYFYEAVNCLALDAYSIYVLNFMTISILILTISYGLSLIRLIYYLLQSLFFAPHSQNIFTAIEVPSISMVFKESLVQVVVITIGLFLFWGKSGLTYIDSTLVAIANVIMIYWIYSLTLIWLFLFLNLFAKRKIR